MAVLVTRKKEEDLIKNVAARVLTTLNQPFSRRQRAGTCNSAVYGRISLNFKLIRDLMAVLVTCKNEEDPIRNVALESPQHLSHFKPIGIFFFKRSRAANSTVNGQIYPNFELIRHLMNVLVTCKNEDDLLPCKTRVLILPGPKANAVNPPITVVLLLKFDCNRPFSL